MIYLKNVYAGYGKTEVLHGITLNITEPGVYVLLGKNGAGKTTTLRVIAGVLKPFRGERKVEGKIAYLTHTSALPEEMTVKEALHFFSKLIGGDVKKVVEEFKLYDLLNKKILDLSEGQKKRISLAKIFMRDADIYLLDEPTTNLDPIFADYLRQKIISLSSKKIVIYTSHNLYEARDIGNYVILIDQGYVKKFLPISEIKVKEHLIGIRASADLSKLFQGYYQGEYYVIKVKDPSEINDILRRLMEKGITIYEIKEMRNPLEDLLLGD